MNRLLMLVFLVAAWTALVIAEDDEENAAMEVNSLEEDTSEERSKQNRPSDLIMAMTLFKNCIGQIISAIGTLLQFKSLMLVAIGTAVNVSRLYLQWQIYSESRRGGSNQMAGGSNGGFSSGVMTGVANNKFGNDLDMMGKLHWRPLQSYHSYK